MGNLLSGGRVSEDALRSLAISERLLGTTEILVMYVFYLSQELSVPKYCLSQKCVVSDLVIGWLKTKTQKWLNSGCNGFLRFS